MKNLLEILNIEEKPDSKQINLLPQISVKAPRTPTRLDPKSSRRGSRVFSQSK